MKYLNTVKTISYELMSITHEKKLMIHLSKYDNMLNIVWLT